MFFGEVAERVDDPAEKLHSRNRDPALAFGSLDRHGLGVVQLRRGGDRDVLHDGAPAGRPVIASAAAFQSRTMPTRSTRNTPSPTFASTRAASARSSATAYSRALSITSPARQARSWASDSSSRPYVRPGVTAKRVRAPSVRPRA